MLEHDMQYHWNNNKKALSCIRVYDGVLILLTKIILYHSTDMVHLHAVSCVFIKKSHDGRITERVSSCLTEKTSNLRVVSRRDVNWGTKWIIVTNSQTFLIEDHMLGWFLYQI